MNNLDPLSGKKGFIGSVRYLYKNSIIKWYVYIVKFQEKHSLDYLKFGVGY